MRKTKKRPVTEFNFKSRADKMADFGEAYRATDLRTLIAKGEKFGTIYADPPWRYSNQKTRASTSKHYETMTVEEITNLPVKKLADENCHLHLWTTNAFLQDAFKVMAAWGFEYKSIFVWCKPEIGMGNYWRVSHEFLLFGIKGNVKFGRRDLRSWGIIDRTKHSEKPERIRDMIEETSPGPRLELFGRRSIDGWTVFGNEVQNDMYIKAVDV